MNWNEQAMSKVKAFARAAAIVCTVVGLIVVVVPSLHGCGKACTLIGCGSIATMSIDLADDVVFPDGSFAIACFNNTCDLGRLPAPEAIAPGSATRIAFPSSFVSGVVWATDVTDHDRLEFDWHSGDDVGSDPQPGDRYSVMVIRSDGFVIATKQATATSYATSHPNGDDCDPACHYAQFP
jgi:hypothetical protein